MAYLINFLGHKTVKSVSFLYIATGFTSALSTTKCTLFLICRYTLALTRWFLKLQPERSETNGAGVKTLLTCYTL